MLALPMELRNQIVHCEGSIMDRSSLWCVIVRVVYCEMLQYGSSFFVGVLLYISPLPVRARTCTGMCVWRGGCVRVRVGGCAHLRAPGFDDNVSLVRRISAELLAWWCRFPLEAYREAFGVMMKRQVVGKVLLLIGDPAASRL
jgi:hypothetical protein